MSSQAREPAGFIRIRGARQHTLKNLDVDIPHGALTVITGISGSGKSSLAFDTIYAEGQRRYVESVSSYARQFLERLPRPDVDTITGLRPAVAIRQANPARSARSTVGTATEAQDDLRLLFARLGTVHCVTCGRPVRADSPQTIVTAAGAWAPDTPVLLLAAVAISARMSWEEQAAHLMSAGYTRIRLKDAIVPLDPLPKLPRGTREVRVVADRFRWRPEEATRLADSAAQAFRRGEGRLELALGDAAPVRYSERWECANCGTPAIAPEPALFSFNSPLGVCPACKGFGNVLTFTRDLIVPDPSLSLRKGAIKPWAGSWRRLIWPRLEKLAKERGFSLDAPWSKLPEADREVMLEGGGWFRGVLPFLRRRQAKSYEVGNRFLVKRFQTALPCDTCGGARLRPEALAVRLGDRTIAGVSAMTVTEAARFVAGLTFTPSERVIAATPLEDLQARLAFLERVDLGYLTLDRLTRTLSGGEAQRIELANALSARLADTLYVLDEPTVGLHPRDTDRLIAILEELAARGNTLVVVEHEPRVMAAAEHVVDLGPGAGEQGGRVLYAGPGGAALAGVNTDTARYLRGEARVTRPTRPAPPPVGVRTTAGRGRHAKRAAAGNGRPDAATAVADAPASWITIEGVTHHNLKDVTVRIPLGRLTAVTGVSGSGKSSLVEEVLYRVARRRFEGREEEPAGPHRGLHGLEALRRVALVDQTPIGRTPRSCPVTYMGAYAALREIYARQPAALARGFKDGAFSFNAPGGRCERCEGAGWVTVEMVFLADLLVPCEVCNGDRFRREVLQVRVKGLNIREALDLTVDQAFLHFASEPKFTRGLHLLRRVGLGYLRLGQPANQLSGGEAQRLKVARELSERGAGPTLYLLDEPTVGLHFADLQRLLEVLDELTARGDTVVVVEHNLDVIRNCDWVVDLGPGGGDAGGELVAEGPPGAVAVTAASWTGRFLRESAETSRAPAS